MSWGDLNTMSAHQSDCQIMPKILNVFSLAKSSSSSIDVTTNLKSENISANFRMRSIDTISNYVSKDIRLKTFSGKKPSELNLENNIPISMQNFIVSQAPHPVLRNPSIGTSFVKLGWNESPVIPGEILPKNVSATGDVISEMPASTVSIEEKEAMEIAASLFYEPNEDSFNTASTETATEPNDSFTEYDLPLSESDAHPNGSIENATKAVDKDEVDEEKSDSDDEESITVSSSTDDDDGAYDDSADSEYEPTNDELSENSDESDEEESQSETVHSKVVEQIKKYGMLSKSAIRFTKFLPSMPAKTADTSKVSASSSIAIDSSIGLQKKAANVTLCSSTFSSNYEKINRLKLLKEQQQKAIEQLKNLSSSKSEISAKPNNFKAYTSEMIKPALTVGTTDSSAVMKATHGRDSIINLKKYDFRERKPVLTSSTSNSTTMQPSIAVSAQNSVSCAPLISPHQIIVLPSSRTRNGVHVPLSSLVLKPMPDGRMQIVNRLGGATPRLIMPKPKVSAPLSVKKPGTLSTAANSTSVKPTRVNTTVMHASIVNGKMVITPAATVKTHKSLATTKQIHSASITSQSNKGTSKSTAALMAPKATSLSNKAFDLAAHSAHLIAEHLDMVSTPNTIARQQIIQSKPASITSSILAHNSIPKRDYFVKSFVNNGNKIRVPQSTSTTYSSLTTYKITPVQPVNKVSPLITVTNRQVATSAVPSANPSVSNVERNHSVMPIIQKQNSRTLSPLALTSDSAISIQQLPAGNSSVINNPIVISNAGMIQLIQSGKTVNSNTFVPTIRNASKDAGVKNVSNQIGVSVTTPNQSSPLSTIVSVSSLSNVSFVGSHANTISVKPILAVPPQPTIQKIISHTGATSGRVLNFHGNQQAFVGQNIVKNNNIHVVAQKQNIIKPVVLQPASVPTTQIMYLNIQPKIVSPSSTRLVVTSSTSSSMVLSTSKPPMANSILSAGTSKSVNSYNLSSPVATHLTNKQNAPVIQLAKKTQLLNMKVNGRNMVCFIPQSQASHAKQTNITSGTVNYLTVKDITNQKTDNLRTQTNVSKQTKIDRLPKLQPIKKATNSVPIKLGVKEKLYRMSNQKHDKWKFLPNMYDRKFPGFLGLELCVSELKGEYFHIKNGAPGIDIDQFFDRVLSKKKKKAPSLKRVNRLKKIKVNSGHERSKKNDKYEKIDKKNKEVGDESQLATGSEGASDFVPTRSTIGTVISANTGTTNIITITSSITSSVHSLTTCVNGISYSNPRSNPRSSDDISDVSLNKSISSPSTSGVTSPLLPILSESVLVTSSQLPILSESVLVTSPQLPILSEPVLVDSNTSNTSDLKRTVQWESSKELDETLDKVNRVHDEREDEEEGKKDAKKNRLSSETLNVSEVAASVPTIIDCDDELLAVTATVMSDDKEKSTETERKRKLDKVSSRLKPPKRRKFPKLLSKIKHVTGGRYLICDESSNINHVDSKNNVSQELVEGVSLESPMEAVSYARTATKHSQNGPVQMVENIQVDKENPVVASESCEKLNNTTSDESNSSLASLPDPNCLSPSRLNPLVVLEKLAHSVAL